MDPFWRGAGAGAGENEKRSGRYFKKSLSQSLVDEDFPYRWVKKFPLTKSRLTRPLGLRAKVWKRGAFWKVECNNSPS